MNVVVIGGMGHIGTYLIPMLVQAGYRVTCISRGQRESYLPHAAWQSVQRITADREQEDAAGTFGARISALAPDVVIDLISYTLESTRALTEALRGKIQHFLHCGSIAVYGHSVQVPTAETQLRQPYNTYGREKTAIESYLHQQARQFGFPSTVLHPGHIVGVGWIPVTPVGHKNPALFAQIRRGEPITLPNLGMETLHHVHAEDVAQAFLKVMQHWGSAVGESFNVVSPAALTLRGYAEAMYAWFGHPPALRYLAWEQWRTLVSAADADETWGHLALSASCSIAKAQRLIDYQPRYGSLDAIFESVAWLMAHLQLT